MCFLRRKASATATDPILFGSGGGTKIDSLTMSRKDVVYKEKKGIEGQKKPPPAWDEEVDCRQRV